VCSVEPGGQGEVVERIDLPRQTRAKHHSSEAPGSSPTCRATSAFRASHSRSSPPCEPGTPPLR
jgi:hypothetical protein